MQSNNLNSTASGGGPSTSSNTATNDNAARFDKLQQTLEAFQENARHLAIIAEDFTPKSQETLTMKLHTLISGMQELSRQKSQFDDVRVPIEVLDYLDQGKNPQMYTKESLDRTTGRNKQVNGKIEVYRKFRAHLMKELVDEMPVETNTYRSVRANPQNLLLLSSSAAAAAAGGGSFNSGDEELITSPFLPSSTSAKKADAAGGAGVSPMDS